MIVRQTFMGLIHNRLNEFVNSKKSKQEQLVEKRIDALNNVIEHLRRVKSVEKGKLKKKTKNNYMDQKR